MTAIATLPVVLGTGIHSARPAASAVGVGGLYSCTTHALVYQTNGSSWTTWATLGSTTAPALVLLEQHSASNSSTLDFTTFISSTYDTYIFKFVAIVPATTTAAFRMRMGTGAGPTYDTGANYGAQNFIHFYNGTAQGSAADSGQNEIMLVRAWLSTGSHPIAGHLELYDPQNATLFKFVSAKFVYPDSTASLMAVAETAGEYNSATAVTAVRFYMSSGNITSGTIRAYGVAK